MSIINDLIMANIPFKELSLNGITSTLDLGDVYIHFRDDGTLDSIVPKEKILHTIIGNDGITRIYLATYNKELAEETLLTIRKCNKYTQLGTELVSLPVHKTSPALTWLFFWNDVSHSWDVEVTEPHDNFDPRECDFPCHVVKAKSLEEAKNILLDVKGVKV